MRLIRLALVLASAFAVGACSSAAEPVPVASAPASAGQVAGDERYLSCRPDCSNESFSKLNLANADMSGIDFSGSVFDFANMAGANLEGANLTDAAMTYVDLRGANLRNANLSGAQLGAAQLDGVVWDNTTCVDGVVRSGSCAP